MEEVILGKKIGENKLSPPNKRSDTEDSELYWRDCERENIGIYVEWYHRD